MAPDTSPDQTPPPPRRPIADTDPLELRAGGSGLHRPLPDDLAGGLDLPPTGGSSIDLPDLARGESDVMEAVGDIRPGAGGGSSNIFDPPIGGSSRFDHPSEATEDIPAAGQKRGTDRLLAGLGQPPQPASDLFAGDNLFAAEPPTSSRYGIPLPRGDSELSKEHPVLEGGPDLGGLSQSDDGGSNLFPDKTESELELGASEVNIGNPGQGDPNPFGGPGSSIFANGAVSGRRLTDGDQIPMMGSSDDPLGAELPFDDLPAVNDIASNIFKGGRGPTAKPVGATGTRGPDADDEPNPAGTIDWSHAPPEGDDFQISQRMTADDVADLGLPDLNNSALVREAAAAVHMDMVDAAVERPAPAPMPAPVPFVRPAVRKPAAPRRKGDGRGWVNGGVLGVVAGVGACAGVYLTGLVPNADPEMAMRMARQDLPAGVDPAVAAQLTKRATEAEAAAKRTTEAETAAQTAQQAADAERARRTRAESDLAAARRATTAANQRVADAESQRKAQAQRLTQAVAQASAAGQELAALKATAGPGTKETAAKLAVAEKEAADARAALAGVIGELRKVKLLDDAAGPDALAKLPAVFQRAAAALAAGDGQKSAEAVRAAETAREAADKAAAESKAQVAELNARLTAQSEAYRRQLADVRAGIVTPLNTAEDRARADAADGLDRGIDAFFAGRLADAERALAAATARDPADARLWYYLGLSRWKLGNQAGAEAAFRRGAEEEGRNRPSRRVLADALSRIQGADRAVLAPYRQ